MAKKPAADKQSAEFQQFLDELTSMDDLLEVYSLLSTQVKDLENSIAERVTTKKRRMELVNHRVMALMNEHGGQSHTTINGRNVHWRTVSKISLGDPVAYYTMLADLLEKGTPVVEVFSALQRRPTAEFVEQWVTDHEGVPPPGVNVSTERQLVYRLNA